MSGLHVLCPVATLRPLSRLSSSPFGCPSHILLADFSCSPCCHYVIDFRVASSLVVDAETGALLALADGVEIRSSLNFRLRVDLSHVHTDC